MKLYSIIIPTYNRAHTLPRAIESLLHQSCQNWELIIIDDGSNDNTSQLIKKYLVNQKIKYYKYTKNRGVLYARNFGVSKISPASDYIIFLDSDDELSPTALNIISHYSTRYPTRNIFKFSTNDQYGHPTSYVSQETLNANLTDFITESKFSGEFHTVCSSRIKKEIIFDNSIHGYEGLLWYQLISKHQAIVSRAVTRVYWRHEGSYTGTLKRFLLNYSYYQNVKLALTKIINKYSSLFRKHNRRRLALLLAVLGRSQIVTQEISPGIKTTIQSILLNPLEWRNFYNLAIIPIIIIKGKLKL